MLNAEMNDLDALRNETLLFLQELLKSQSALLLIQEPKQAALVQGNWDELQKYEKREASCQQALKFSLSKRSQLLQRFHQAGVAGGTLKDVLRTLGWYQHEEIQQLMQQVQENSEELRRFNWSLWIMSQRASRHYTQLLNFISQGLTKPAGYQQHEGTGFESGGALLDASI